MTKIKAAVRTFCDTAAFLCINGKEVFYMMGANGAVLFSLLIYAALLYGAVRLIKYFIRYGIDYYFQKLEQQPEQTEHKE